MVNEGNSVLYKVRVLILVPQLFKGNRGIGKSLIGNALVSPRVVATDFHEVGADSGDDRSVGGRTLNCPLSFARTYFVLSMVKKCPVDDGEASRL